MAAPRTRTRGPQLNPAEQIMNDRLLQRGYNPQEVTEILRLANMMARGRSPELRMVDRQGNPTIQSRIQTSDLQHVAQFLAQCRARPNENPRDILYEGRDPRREGVSSPMYGIRGPERRLDIAAVPVRAPPTSPYRYEVSMGGRTFTVFSSRAISLVPRGRGQEREHPLVEAVRRYEDQGSGPVVAVWQTEPRQEEIPQIRVTTFRRRFDEAFRRGRIGDTVMVNDVSPQASAQRQRRSGSG